MSEYMASEKILNPVYLMPYEWLIGGSEHPDTIHQARFFISY